MYITWLNCKKCGNKYNGNPNGDCICCDCYDIIKTKKDAEEKFRVENRLIAKSLRIHEIRMRKIEEDILLLFKEMKKEKGHSHFSMYDKI